MVRRRFFSAVSNDEDAAILRDAREGRASRDEEKAEP
jgi:hypothetical protein